MREILAQDVTAMVARLCQEANIYLGEDVLRALEKARNNEPSMVGCAVLDQILLQQDYLSAGKSLNLNDCVDWETGADYAGGEPVEMPV